ncbi:unnamed protein product [Paramecium pentaurelia]|uniref:Uncharacterized protein n=1 Tax=Paramecium pentaurelia TaxID=43138 RepID=A0A8S1YRS1_9CILI|nr:unnamed protein product [Paramecium pentaurelia]
MLKRNRKNYSRCYLRKNQTKKKQLNNNKRAKTTLKQKYFRQDNDGRFISSGLAKLINKLMYNQIQLKYQLEKKKCQREQLAKIKKQNELLKRNEKELALGYFFGEIKNEELERKLNEMDRMKRNQLLSQKYETVKDIIIIRLLQIR